MKKPRLLILLAAALLLLNLAGCGPHSLNAAGTVHELCKRNLNGESFAELCDQTLSPDVLDGFFDGVIDAGGQYVVIPDGAAIYRTLEGGDPSLDENTLCVGVYAGTNKLHINAQGYAMVRYDPGSEACRVTDLVLQPVE